MKKIKIPRTCFYCQNLTRNVKPQICGIDGAKVYSDDYTFCDQWLCIYGEVKKAAPTDKKEYYEDYLDFKYGIQRGKRRDDKMPVSEKLQFIRYFCEDRIKNQNKTEPPQAEEAEEMPADVFSERY